MNQLADAADSIQVILCGIGGDSFALEMDRVAHLLAAEDFATEWAADGDVGVLKHPEGEISVYRLSRLVGVGDPPGEHWKHIVIVRSQSRLWGFLVGRVSDAVHVPAERVTALPKLIHRLGRVPFAGLIELEDTDSAPQSSSRAAVRSGPASGMKAERTALLIDTDRLDPEADAPGSEVPAPAPSSDPASEAACGPPSARRRGLRGRRQLLAFSVSEPQQGLEANPSVALSITQVMEILEPQPIVPLPASPPFVLGLVRWRDGFVAVVDIAFRLGLPPFPSDGSPRFVIARAGAGEVVAFPINPGIITLRLPVESMAVEPPVPINVNLTRGIFLLEQATVVVPDIPGILSLQ